MRTESQTGCFMKNVKTKGHRRLFGWGNGKENITTVPFRLPVLPHYIYEFKEISASNRAILIQIGQKYIILGVL